MSIIKIDSSEIGGTKKWYYEDIPNGKDGVDYRINCGFKAKKIIIAGGYIGTYQYPHNLVYDEDESSTKFRVANSSYTCATQFNIDGSGNPSEGPILMAVPDATGFTIRTPSTATNRHCYLLALG